MSDYMDRLPSHEVRKLRQMMSAEAYERLREKVKGPEDLEREMEKNAERAELSLALETEPEAQEALRRLIERDLGGQGLEKVLETIPSAEARQSLERGHFRVVLSSHPRTHDERVMVLPEGNVEDRIPVKPHLSDRYVAQGLALVRYGH